MFHDLSMPVLLLLVFFVILGVFFSGPLSVVLNELLIVD